MKTLLYFKQFIEELNLNNSRIYKESILNKYKDSEEVKFYLNFLLNPYIITGISEKKYNRLTQMPNREILIPEATAYDLFNYIKTYNTGADNFLETVANYYHRYNLSNSELETIFKGVLTKNLPLGIDAKTVNKVIPGLIPTFNVQLANKYFDNPKVVEGKMFCITTKIDGMRCIMLKEKGKVTFWSRQGQPIEGLVDLEKEALEKLPDDICLDGELIAKETSKEDTYKNTMKTARTKDAEKHNLKMMVFDCMTSAEFRNQKCEDFYLARRANLLTWFSHYNLEHYMQHCAPLLLDPEAYRNENLNEINRNYDYFTLLPILYTGSDTSKIEEILLDQVNKGEEGIMINIAEADSKYQFRRTNYLLKCKLFNDVDLQCVGFEEGTNRHTGKLGALLVKYKDNIVRVGSGFTDDLREEIWNHKEEWLGRTIVVKYFEETYNQEEGVSLRFPVYLDYRDDKKAEY